MSSKFRSFSYSKDEKILRREIEMLKEKISTLQKSKYKGGVSTLR